MMVGRLLKSHSACDRRNNQPAMTTDTRTLLTQTKAGRRFMGFMKTFNQGDPAQFQHTVEQYITEESLAKHSPEIWLAQLKYIYAITGGLRAQQVLVTDEYYVAVLMQAHKDQRFHVIEMVVAEDYPHKIASLIQRVAQD